MGSARTFVISAAAAALLLTVSGCSEDEPAAEASPSELAHYTAAPGSATPTESPATGATACVKTKGMSVEQLTDYLKNLRSGSGEYRSKGLTLDSSGLNFTPEAIQRPCEAVTVKLAHYWVDVEKARDATAVSAARYEYHYTLFNVTAYKAGPQDGRVADTAPPGGNGCQGTVSVVYLGQDIPLRSLPYDLELTDTTAPVPVDVDGDGVLSAIYVSPVDVESC